MNHRGYRVGMDLSPEERQFVEAHGLFFEGLGLPRIGGRILALLQLAEAPLTLDDIAGSLEVSRASVSTNTRHFVTLGLVDIVSPIGERRTFYQWSPQAWERRVTLARSLFSSVGNFARMGVAAVGDQRPAATERFLKAQRFAGFMDGHLGEALARWEEVEAGRR
jgi:DNA-binding MarR family transcriptional regulator